MKVQIERAFARMSGNLAFSTPETLHLNESAEIELLLSPGRSTSELEKALRAPGVRESARIRITDEMEAMLTGPRRGVEIQQIGSPRQVVKDYDVTEWKWEVEPTRTGTLRLHLTLIGFIEERGKPTRARTIRSFDRTLTIRVTWRQRASSFFSSNWQWLWTAILLPVAAWAIKRHRGRRNVTDPKT